MVSRVFPLAWSGGYNINDLTFHWTRGNESVSGLDTLKLAQYTVEDHYTSVSEAIYETGEAGRFQIKVYRLSLVLPYVVVFLLVSTSGCNSTALPKVPVLKLPQRNPLR